MALTKTLQKKLAQSKSPLITQALGVKTSVIPTVTSPTPVMTKKPFTGSIGVVLDDYANKNGAITALEEKLGAKISIISIYKQFGNAGNKDITQADLAYIKSRGIRLQIAWEPWKTSEANKQSEDFLREIPTGKYDEYIRNFAKEIKAFGNPVVIRFAHEMNGDWYPWGKRPEEFKTAYRYIHAFFARESVTNTSWMWSVNVSENPHELGRYYPGDDVVNIIGVDCFNFGKSKDYGGWRPFSELFGPTYRYLYANYSKPITISETASTETGGNKAEWIQNMFAVLTQNYPKINELVWFNVLKEADWRIESSRASSKAFFDSLHI